MTKNFNFKKVIKLIVLFLFVVFIGLQFIPRTYNQSDKLQDIDITKTFEVPNDVQTILKTSCYDCHSNYTNYPWYNKVQPATWFLEGHITDGKKELNFSEFGAYSNRRQKTKFKSILSQVESDEMPLPSYTYIHWDAKLSDKEKQILRDWINSVQDELRTANN